ncbi:hypothetical protein SGRIM128S_02619 [Streptomyces griseomycini]
MPHDVPDDQRDPAARQRDGVVPVAADPRGLRGRQVAGRQPHAGAAGQVLRQHGALQLVRDVRLTPVQHRLVDAQRAVRGELRGHQQVVGLERDALRAAQEQRRADHPAPAAQRREDRPLPVRHGRGAVRTEELGQRGAGGRRVREHRPDAAQHLGERAAGPHRAQLLADRVQFVRLRRGDRGEPALGVAVGGDPVGTAQSQHQRAGGPLVADRQRLAQVDQDRVGEGGHGGPAQPHHDLVQVEAAGDPPGRRADEPQPVAVPPHRRGPSGCGDLSGAALPAVPALRRAAALVRGRLGRDALGHGPRPVRVRRGALLGARLGVLGDGAGGRVLAGGGRVRHRPGRHGRGGGRGGCGGRGPGRARLAAGAGLYR